MMVPTIAMAIVMGVFPGIFLRPMEPSVNRAHRARDTPEPAGAAVAGA